jgi:hypothetical protein
MKMLLLTFILPFLSGFTLEDNIERDVLSNRFEFSTAIGKNYSMPIFTAYNIEMNFKWHFSPYWGIFLGGNYYRYTINHFYFYPIPINERLNFLFPKFHTNTGFIAHPLRGKTLLFKTFPLYMEPFVSLSGGLIWDNIKKRWPVFNYSFGLSFLFSKYGALNVYTQNYISRVPIIQDNIKNIAQYNFFMLGISFLDWFNMSEKD